MPRSSALFTLSLPLMAMLLISGCRTGGGRDKELLMQTSTIEALLGGVYGGHIALTELREYGDFGIGTFDRLDGEMVVHQGTVYQVRADGKVYLPPLSTTTPFAAVTFFGADQQVAIPGPLSLEELYAFIDRQAPNQNMIQAIEITGRFASIRTRSVPAQEKPYRPLVEIAREQPEFNYSEISGVLVGFRCPPFMARLNVPGYHLHFLDDERKVGGHLLDLNIESGTLKIDSTPRAMLIIPDEGNFAGADLSKERGGELHDVER